MDSINEKISYKGSRILVVDDNKINIKIASRILSSFNIEVDEAESGKTCIQKINAGNIYDLILMDDMMPEMNGVETLHTLKENIVFNIPTIALTANNDSGMREKYLKEGFNDYLAKPIDKIELNKILSKYLKKVIYEEDEESIFDPLPEDLYKIDHNEIADSNNISILTENGIDVLTGINLLGDIEAYNDTLNQFILESDERILRLKHAQDIADMSNYAIDVHAMKSDSKYLGFNKLAEMSYEHEMKSKENDISYVRDHFEELMQEFHRIDEIIKKYLKK